MLKTTLKFQPSPPPHGGRGVETSEGANHPVPQKLDTHMSMVNVIHFQDVKAI